MDELGCTAKRLSELSGISMTQISRYRNGICVPYSESDAVSLLSKGIVYMAKERSMLLTHFPLPHILPNMILITIY